MAIITQAEARQAIPTLTSDSSDLALVIDRVEIAIARYLGFPPSSSGGSPLINQAMTLYSDGEAYGVVVEGRRLRLPVWPVDTLVIRQDSTHAWAADTTVTSTEYEVRAATGVVTLLPTASVAWYTGLGDIRVTGNYGWSTVPGDIKQAAIEATAHVWRHRGIGATPQVQATPAEDEVLPPISRSLLAPHRCTAGWVG